MTVMVPRPNKGNGNIYDGKPEKDTCFLLQKIAISTHPNAFYTQTLTHDLQEYTSQLLGNGTTAPTTEQMCTYKTQDNAIRIAPTTTTEQRRTQKANVILDETDLQDWDPPHSDWVCGTILSVYFYICKLVNCD